MTEQWDRLAALAAAAGLARVGEHVIDEDVTPTTPSVAVSAATIRELVAAARAASPDRAGLPHVRAFDDPYCATCEQPWPCAASPDRAGLREAWGVVDEAISRAIENGEIDELMALAVNLARSEIAALLDSDKQEGLDDMETCPTCWQPVPRPQRGDHDYGIPLSKEASEPVRSEGEAGSE